MRLAKEFLDFGLFTNNLEPVLEFWQNVVGLPFEEMLPTGRGSRQYRHGLNGAVLKINNSREPMRVAPSAGYHELLVARDGLSAVQSLRDPDGNAVSLVPMGYRGVTSAGIVVKVRSVPASRAYYGMALDMDEIAPGEFRCGESMVLLEEEPGRQPAGEMRAPGYRYMTVQVWDADAEFNAIVERGGTGASAPRTMGEVARFGFVRDPDGNWLEISQRASLTGALPPNE